MIKLLKSDKFISKIAQTCDNIFFLNSLLQFWEVMMLWKLIGFSDSNCSRQILFLKPNDFPAFFSLKIAWDSTSVITWTVIGREQMTWRRNREPSGFLGHIDNGKCQSCIHTMLDLHTYKGKNGPQFANFQL